MGEPSQFHVLSEEQRKLFQMLSRPMLEEDVLSIRKMVAQYFYEKATRLAGEEAIKRGYTEDTYLAWLKGEDRIHEGRS